MDIGGNKILQAVAARINPEVESPDREPTADEAEKIAGEYKDKLKKLYDAVAASDSAVREDAPSGGEDENSYTSYTVPVVLTHDGTDTASLLTVSQTHLGGNEDIDGGNEYVLVDPNAPDKANEPMSGYFDVAYDDSTIRNQSFVGGDVSAGLSLAQLQADLAAFETFAEGVIGDLQTDV